MAAEFFHADGQTDVTKPTVAFRNFANAPKSQALKRAVSNKIRLEGEQRQTATVSVLLFVTEEESVSTACSAFSNPDKTS